MSVSRREFCEWLAIGAGNLPIAADSAMAREIPGSAPLQPVAATGSHIGNLYPFVQQLADQSPLELSFLRPEFTNLRRWQTRARAKVFEFLLYAPPPVAPQPQLIRRTDKGDYIEEYLTFQTAPGIRVPAHVLLPKGARQPAPGMVVLHSHDGRYFWGKEKVVENESEHPVLTEFKKYRYGGKAIAAEYARQGYVTIAIDMFYWGERRMILDDDPAAYRDRPNSMPENEIDAFNQRASQNESLIARSLHTAGISWPGLVLWDDLRTVDYLASRPEVDRRRIGCVGLSVGGYRSFLLAALDERIKAAVAVGWMTSFASQIKRHVSSTIGFSFHLPGLYRYLDLPDLAALIAPRAVLVINGSQDRLFALDGVNAAFEKIGRCYAKAGLRERQRCSLYNAPHEFNLSMQDEARDWFKRWL
ncbi:MAG: alpha/beta hydrolase family protein [Blastocatellia bacterium]|nr:alpha/beta hydrolase family protein [Blastocatellia bacterium]